MSWLFILTFGCLVSKKKYDALSAELERTRADLTGQVAERDQKILTLEQALAEEQGKLQATETERAALSEQLEAANSERAALLKDRTRLKASVAEMEEALRDLDARKRASEERIAQYRDLLERFKTLIDAGQLQVRIVDGRMVVQMATDILFASGSAELSKEGRASLQQVAAILSSIPARKYQIEGHTDNVPIQTAQYPSNWELASSRATVVLKTMLEAGLTADRVSAASFADTRPVGDNASPEGRKANRRIEIVVVPDLSQLPGFEELQAIASEQAGGTAPAP